MTGWKNGRACHDGARQRQQSWATETGATNGHSGVEAAKTGESHARKHGRECCARDGTVGVAQYVVPYSTGLKEKSQRDGDRSRL